MVKQIGGKVEHSTKQTGDIPGDSNYCLASLDNG